MKFSLATLSSLTLLVAPWAVAAASAACPYLEAAAPVEYELPASALTNPLVDLPVKFVGVKSVITRSQVPFGSKPRVVVQRYSSKPTIAYDPTDGSVTISSAACSGGVSSEEGSGATSSTKNSLMTMASTLAMYALGGEIGAGLALAGAALTNLPTAHAQDESCMPSVEVMVEAPAAYRGAVETCLAEVTDQSQCPLPFPTFPTCSTPSPTCGVAVVGAGAGGLYTALRMVDEGAIEASDVCIFETTERVGGRLFSLRGLGPDNDLSVDAGGYRTWPEFTPTLHALITEYLNIPMDCYDPSEVPCQKFNIVDGNGNKAGFATFVEEMMRRLTDAGACFYPFHEVRSLAKIEAPSDTATARNADGTATELHFTNGATAVATFTTILGVPQRPLLNILRNSNFANSIMTAAKWDAVHSVQTVIASKLYLYYPRGQVFWRKLNLGAGDFELDGDARNMLLAGRYHDGHVECEDENDPDTCRGFLLAVYANDLSGNKAQFFRRYQRDRPEPVTILSNSDLESAEFLKHAHAQLEQYHLYENPGANYTGSEALAAFRNVNPPEFAVLSTWNEAVPWAGGAWHAWTDIDNIDLAQKPLADSNIFVVNEAFSLLHGWAEGSIKLADSILEDYFNIARPWNFEVSDFVQFVQQTNSRECVEGEGGSSGGGTNGGSSGGGGGDTSGGGGGASNPALCFTEDALVTMADGSLKRIVDVQLGDRVVTGTGKGNGLVTEKLIHPVKKTVPVAVLATKDGDLTGTPEHPIYHQGEWIEMGDLTSDLLTLTEAHVEAFYNLEIDGDQAGKSSHSYVVNGIVASGLGDNEDLNKLSPRQKIWKDEVIDVISQ